MYLLHTLLKGPGLVTVVLNPMSPSLNLVTILNPKLTPSLLRFRFLLVLAATGGVGPFASSGFLALPSRLSAASALLSWYSESPCILHCPCKRFTVCCMNMDISQHCTRVLKSISDTKCPHHLRETIITSNRSCFSYSCMLYLFSFCCV